MDRPDFLNRLLWFDELDSTNNKSRELIRENRVNHGSIISAFSQVSGKGYAGNSWESEAGKNITASWILSPGFLAPNLQFRLTKVISLAIRDFIKYYLGSLAEICIKWPNDIYADNKKIAGVLIENNIMAEKIRDSICGIGININQRKFVSSAPNPVSLSMITGQEYLIEGMIGHIDDLIFKWYELLQRDELKMIDHNYLGALYRVNQYSEFKRDNNLFGGYIRGTDPAGRLIIEGRGGIVTVFDFKDIAMVI